MKSSNPSIAGDLRRHLTDRNNQPHGRLRGTAVRVGTWLLFLHLAGSVSWAQTAGTEVKRTAPVAGRASAPAATLPALPKPKAGDDMQPVEAGDKKIGTDWVRLKYDDQGELVGMQTAIVRYAAAPQPAGGQAKGAQVDLIGAVHIADAAYYEKLNERFTEYDALLYELVAPEGTVVPKGRGTSSLYVVGAMQNGIKSILELDHQLEEVDYTKPNFVHADMSPDQFLQAMKDRNESFLQMYFRLLGEAMAHQSEMSAKGDSVDFDLFSALFAQDRPRRLKIILAKQLSEMESLLVSFGGENGSVIISDRNKIAMGVLKEQLAAGKQHVGVFYGAGHLTDMDRRLREDFGLQPVAITWLTAWNLAAKP